MKIKTNKPFYHHKKHIIRITSTFILFLCFSVFSVSASPLQQGSTITGTVTDKSEPMPGVSVTLKGTSTGTITDLDGKYSIQIPDNQATLIFSFMGYATQEIVVGNRKVINVALTEDTQLIDEVVVVGYGTQKKVNLTGAVAAIKVDEKLSSRSLTSVSAGLQGMLPGLAVSQNSGMAGKNDFTMLIRGLGTVNNANPLVVVDGMPDVDINRLNMSDIESISVLKDAASAAVYGSRAANGVILITTKSGKGSEKAEINVTGSYSIGKPTKAFNFMADYPRALTVHQRSQSVGTLRSNLTYRDGTIDQWLALGMIDPLRYPNTDWWDLVLRDDITQNYNISASGSNDKSNFFASVGIMDQEGMQLNNDYRRYNARFNFDYKIRKNINVGVRFDGNWSKFVYLQKDGFTDDTPTNTGGFDFQYAIAGITPYDPVTGYYGGVMAYNEDAQAYQPYTYLMNNLNRRNRQEANTSMYIDWTVIKGLTARVEYALNYYNQFRYNQRMPNRAYNFQTETWGSRVYVGDNAGIENNTNTGYKTQLNARLDYDITIASHHNIKLMASYNEEYWYDRSQRSYRDDRIHPGLKEIDAALTRVQETGGNSSTEGLRSYIGRVNYTAYDKYLLEINFRADGSSKFLPGHQWGFFPSAAVGWRFLEEDFMKSLIGKWMSNGKFRASYGKLGNNSGVSRYEQQETLGSSNYIIGGSIVKGLVNRKMVNQDLTWESTAVLNFGLDVGFFNNRLNAELDYYDRLTTKMNRPSDFSILLSGAYNPPPRRNIGNLRNRGFEVNLTWKDTAGDFSYMINGNVSFNKTRLEKWSEFLDKGTVFLDMPYRFVYAYEDTGIAQTWEDVYSTTPQGASPGDLLLVDKNGDGRINDNDKVAYHNFQSDRPTTNFALNASLSWKGIDCSFMFQGAAGRKAFWQNVYNKLNVDKRYASSWEHWNNPWSWDNRDGKWPRLAGNGNNQTQSTFWLDNLSYLRLKNVQIGYSLPRKWMKVLNIGNIRIFGSAENIFTITQYRGLDPEKEGHASDAYPLVKSYSFGFNITI